ncbi:MAG: LLM class F420-dependent oxidoreductase, partial [Actinobacteria bacterium]|nr:LLM class F420-dependent oxidoreductase [Actinomycetota bacterium]
QMQPGPKLDEARAVVEAAAREAGRDPARIGMEGRLAWQDDGPDAVLAQVERWRAAGATQVSINTMGSGLGSVEGHLAVLRSVAAALELVPA